VDPANVLDQIQLVDSAPPGGGRRTPPPLPPFSPAPSFASASASAPRRKTVAYVGMFVALIAVAVAAGLIVGRRAGATRPSPGAGSPSASGSVLTIPPVEIR
jgi:hypothetical protein